MLEIAEEIGGGVAAAVLVVFIVRSREVQPWLRSDGRLRNLRMRRSEVNPLTG